MRLYIDPGTGSMLFAVLVGILGLAGYFFKGLWMKLRFLLTGGKRAESAEEAIPFVIFSDDKRYWPVFEPICRELDRQGFDVRYMTASPDDPALENPYEHVRAEFIGEGNRAFMKLNFLKATLLLSTTPGLDVYQWKRSRDVKAYVHIPHMAGELTTYRMFGTDYYDVLLLSGQYQIEDCRALERLRELPPKECRLVGIPYLDEKAEKLKKTPPEPHERTILVAPSWGGSSLFNRFGRKLLDELLSTGYHVIVRPHPQSFTSEKELIEGLMRDYPQLEWNRDTDNFDVLNRSDLLISDFSGVIFDFALVFDKPVICAYTGFDKAPYDAWWLDTPIWTATAIPRLGKILSEESLPQLKDLIEECLTDEVWAESRRAVREETWAYPGEGAARAAACLMEKYRELVSLPEEPAQTAKAPEAAPAEAAKGEEPLVLTPELSGAEVKSDAAYPPSAPSEIALGEEAPVTAESSAVSEETDAEREEPQTEKEQPPKAAGGVRTKIAAAVIAGAVALALIFGVRLYLDRTAEKAAERSDLELMRVAEAITGVILSQEEIREKGDYWLEIEDMTLLKSSLDKPLPYGRGTARIGGALREYDEDFTSRFAYDEGTDYTNKILKVTVDPENGEILVEWVEAD